MHPARSRLTVFSAAVLAAVLAALLPVTMTSATGGPAARNGVGASHPQMILAVGSSQPVLAGEGRCEGLTQPGFVSGLCVAAEDTGLGTRAPASCGGASFTPGTKVLLATGAAVPIATLKAGDKVLATNSRTGKTQAEPVTAVLVHHDTDKYDLRVKADGKTAVIRTTSSHLFYDQTAGRWVKAASLKYGDKLQTSGGTVATAAGGYVPSSPSGWMWDLTVPGGGDHDLYIDTVVATVLVHNCSFPGPEARAKVPSDWGEGQPNAKGIGQRWTDPGNPGNGIRIDQGNLDSPFPSQQVDHVVVRSGGQILGPDGSPIEGPLAANPSAHIPLSDWLQWALWNEP